MILDSSKSARLPLTVRAMKARRHALRPCEHERKVVDMFSLKTFDKLFLEGEQRANLIKLYESLVVSE